MDQRIECPKCGGGMDQGFTLGRFATGWHRGPPVRSLKATFRGPKDPGIPIGAFRCTTCGYLEFYARQEF